MRILLAVDGSEHASHAIEALRCLTPAQNVMALHVLDLPRLTYPMLGPEIAKDLAMTVEQAMRADGQQVMKRTMSHLSDYSVPVERRLEEGGPADLILSVGKEIQADLIVMGARGLGQIHELVLGSVSHQVLTKAHCPVLIIKSSVRQIKRVLLPLQDLEDVQRVKPMLAKHPFHADTEVHAFTVVPIPRSFLRAGVSASETKMQLALESVEKFMDKAVDDLRSTAYMVKGFVGMGAPAETILEQETETKPDLIMMGVQHPSVMDQIILGSVSHTVLHRSKGPIMVIR